MADSATALVRESDIQTTFQPSLIVESSEDGRLQGRFINYIYETNGLYKTQIEYQYITSINYPNLEEINDGSTISFYNLPFLEKISFPTLTVLDTNGGLFFSGPFPSLTTVGFLELTHITGQFEISASINLHSLLFSSLISVGDGSVLNFSGNALTQASINTILIQMAAINSFGLSVTLDLSGGTNAAPSGAGITAENSLTFSGWTVLTN